MSVVLCFTVLGPPVGDARVTRDRARRKRIAVFKEAVGFEAITAQRRARMRLPKPGLDGRVYVLVRCYFGSKDKRHPDPGNVQKAVQDALYLGSAGGDKMVGGAFETPVYVGKELARTEVEVWSGQRTITLGAVPADLLK